MKKRLLKMPRKSIAIILAFLMMLSFMLTGCEQMLKDLATDFILVEIVDNDASENSDGKLLSESKDNEPMYIYRIDAQITNNYIMELTNAVINLNMPDNVVVTSDGESRTINESTFPMEEVVEYSWVVRIPVTDADQNIEYSVSIESDVSSIVEAYGLLWVDGRNQNDNRMDFSADTWKFANYSQVPIPLTQEDYEALTVGMSNTNVESFKTTIAENANGYCYGMAATSILTKMGRLPVSSYDSTAANLHKISKTKKVKSVIGYYWITQTFQTVWDERTEFNRKSTEEKLSIIEQKAKSVESGGNPFILSFNTEADGGGHAVVGYSHEGGSFIWNDKEYDSRILIYDSNYPDWTANSCLYYNKGTSEWYIPNYPNSSAITRALSNLNVMDIKNINSAGRSANSYVTARGNQQLAVYATDGTLIGSVDGTTTGTDKPVVAFRNDGADDSLIVALPKAEKEQSFVFKSNAESKQLDLRMQYDEFYMQASADGQDSIEFSPEGDVSMLGKAEGVNIRITANEGKHPTKWPTLSVSAESAVNPEVEIVDNGYVVKGDKIKNLTVSAQDNKTASKVQIKTDEKNILITQDGDNICAKSDKDNDGDYETVLATGGKSDPTDPTKGDPGKEGDPNSSGLPGSGSAKGGGTGSATMWIIIAFAAMLIIGAIVAVIIIACRSGNKNNDDKFEIPIINESSSSQSVEKEAPDNQAMPVKQTAPSKETKSALPFGIELMSGADKGKQIEMTDEKLYTVGKSSSVSTISLGASYEKVSRVHLSVTYIDRFKKYYVVDCSSNGTYLENGKRLAKNTRTPIEKGTVIKLADDNCKIKLI